MKIRLTIIEEDARYLSKIVQALSVKYSEKIELRSFSSDPSSPNILKDSDVILAYEGFDVQEYQPFEGCVFAYLSNRQGVDKINGFPAVCKFQKVDEIYKQVLNLYAEIATGVVGKRTTGEMKTKTLLFTSPCGGAGVSTIAAACALHFSAKGKRVLYFDLELFQSVGLLFSGTGQYNLSQIIMAIKNRKTNLQMKLESCVQQDRSGVFFFAEPSVALDMKELNYEERRQLLSELEQSAQYDYIIIDADFAVDLDSVSMYKKLDAFVWIDSGTEVSKRKIHQANGCIRALSFMDSSMSAGDIYLISNMASGEFNSTPAEQGMRNLGNFPRYRGTSTRQIAESIATSDLFDQFS